ncbi:MAG: glycosyltransferase family 2 protein [Flavobacteriia bacterium]|nr:glycosyltransferase family 2 protein [Flavobacteriia bacterium]MBH2024342.1 glycosyltransferase family 2 protein [Flavobacteriales bacterium]
MKAKQKISVIIPMYNAENTVMKALDSVRVQKGSEYLFEIIVVNDGSTDGSRSVVEKYRKLHPQMNIILLNQDNSGVSKARNAAMEIATGEFIALLDSDDEWLPEKTERQMPYLLSKNKNIDFISCRRKNQKIQLPYVVGKNALAGITFRKIMLRNEAQPSTVIFKRKILENTGFFDPNQRYAEDINYWLNISVKNTMFILDEELVIAGGGKRTFGVSGLSANLAEMEKGLQKNLIEMWSKGRITRGEYFLYLIFFRIKFAIRVMRNKYLSVQGR